MLPFYHAAYRRPTTDNDLYHANVSKKRGGTSARAQGGHSVFGGFLERVRAPLTVALLGLFVLACSSSPAPREFVRSEPGGNVNLTIAASVANHPPTTITVTIDDALVASQLLAALAQAPKHYRLKVSPGHHEITARANTGRTKEVFPIFIQENSQWLTLTYLCACEGGGHTAGVAHFSLEQPQPPATEVQLQQ